jgi:hypothetical protein
MGIFNWQINIFHSILFSQVSCRGPSEVLSSLCISRLHLLLQNFLFQSICSAVFCKEHKVVLQTTIIPSSMFSINLRWPSFQEVSHWHLWGENIANYSSPYTMKANLARMFLGWSYTNFILLIINPRLPPLQDIVYLGTRK